MSATGERGFTLLEMMIAVAIMALITGIGWPSISHLIARATLAQTRSTLTLALAKARSHALRRDAPMTVGVVAGAPVQLVFSDGSAAMALPQGVSVDWPQAGLAIYGDGSSDGTSGQIHTDTVNSRYSVDPATARPTFAP